MLQKFCLGEVCQYLRVREITRTSSTEGVGLQPPQPGSARHASGASTLPFVAQERNTLGSAGSGNSGAVSETKAAFLLSPTHMNDLRIFLCMGNECGCCSAFQNGLFWVKKKFFCLGNTNPAIQNKSPCVRCAWFSSSSSIYVRAGDLFQTKLWVKWYVRVELTNQLHIGQEMQQPSVVT